MLDEVFWSDWLLCDCELLPAVSLDCWFDCAALLSVPAELVEVEPVAVEPLDASAAGGFWSTGVAGLRFGMSSGIASPAGCDPAAGTAAG